ncbi:MAG: DNA cytosine methyltransferase [Bacteroidales bacterium]|jgi:DNA (cytosine-5)-methyltransferase 1|nr:DNA cytosine methyltransferase [Bacteroidales bacterium]
MKKIFWIDLFAGAGGTTTGIHLLGDENVEVVACVNHDEMAIESHKANHPNCNHFPEDIRNMEVVIKLVKLCVWLRHLYPGCIINIWASLECTNYSKAKGGLPRDADSRTLAYSLYDYISELEPDYVYIENVREFMAWGPLDQDGKPVSKKNGIDYIKWIKTICTEYNYLYDYKLIDSADYGAYTSRLRYFGIFAKPNLPIVWPEPEYTKKPGTGLLFTQLKKWKSVKEVLDLNDEGKSIFGRKKDLSEATYERILAGLIKFVAGGKENWLLKYNSMNKNQKHNPPSLEEPCPVVSTQNRLGIVNCSFITKYFSGRPEHKNIPLTGPAATIKTKDSQYLVNCNFLAAYYSTGENIKTIDEPAGTVRTKDTFSKICVNFFDQQYGNSCPKSLNDACPAIVSNPKQNLVTCNFIMDTNFNNVGNSIEEPAKVITASHKQHYLVNPQYNSKGSSLDNPCFSLIARMDKKPPYIVQTESGTIAIIIYPCDSPSMKKIKEFMCLYGIIDIKMRMLRIDELLKIQGFPDKYELKGSKADQKKFIGNAVVPVVAQKLAESNLSGIKKLINQTIKVTTI